MSVLARYLGAVSERVPERKKEREVVLHQRGLLFASSASMSRLMCLLFPGPIAIADLCAGAVNHPLRGVSLSV